MKCERCGRDFEKYQWNQKKCYDCISETNPKFKKRPEKTCGVCGTVFRPRVIRQTYCSTGCNTKAWETGYFMRTYGLSREEYDRLFQEQNHRCKICGIKGFRINSKTEKTLCVDHCHTTGKIRGLLCHNCNRALGLLRDSKNLLQSALSYLEGSETIRKEYGPSGPEAHNPNRG